MNIPNKETVQEDYFTFMETEGFDRRHAILEITAVWEDGKGYRGEVFDTRTAQILWKGKVEDEETALNNADAILEKLEKINGFGSISLAGR